MMQLCSNWAEGLTARAGYTWVLTKTLSRKKYVVRTSLPVAGGGNLDRPHSGFVSQRVFIKSFGKNQPQQIRQLIRYHY
jgi:hypothetical protein